MSNTITSGVFRQRVGLLIEFHIISKFALHPNKRQRTQGYYDAYNNNKLYEIKASSVVNNRFTINVLNHEKLLEKYGEYIFVSYAIKNTDKDLKLMSDIQILNIYQVSARNINEVLITKARKNTLNKSIKTRKNKEMYRLSLQYVRSCEGVETKDVI